MQAIFNLHASRRKLLLCFFIINKTPAAEILGTQKGSFKIPTFVSLAPKSLFTVPLTAPRYCIQKTCPETAQSFHRYPRLCDNHALPVLCSVCQAFCQPPCLLAPCSVLCSHCQKQTLACSSCLWIFTEWARNWILLQHSRLIFQFCQGQLSTLICNSLSRPQILLLTMSV